MANLNGTNLAAKIVPFTTDDTYATHVSTYGEGGWHEVATIAERDAIPQSRLKDGMACFVRANNIVYIYNIQTHAWVALEASGDVVDVVVNEESVVTDKVARFSVPTKTSDITNDSDFITESDTQELISSHHDSTKQDTLAEQTAYSAKGSGTKVAQITTNSLGQVTNIDEVDITKTTLTDLGITATSAELNTLDGIIANTQELNYTKGVTSGIQVQLNGKQPTISNLSTIENNALAGAGAATTISGYGNIVTHNTSEFATSLQGSLASSAIQPNDNISELNNDIGYTTNSGTVTSIAVSMNGATKGTVTTSGTIDLGTVLTSHQSLSDLGVTATAQELNYTDGVTSSIQTQLDGKLTENDIINTAASTATDKALSANIGRDLQDQINNLKARGRFLSTWNCATGLPETDPTELTSAGIYEYKSGDYYIIGTVASGAGINYKPNGNSYTPRVASTTQETESVAIGGSYYFDGINWVISSGTTQTVTFSAITGQPTDNLNLATALNAKVTGNSTITGATKAKITYDSKGLVTSGTDLTEADIPNLHLSKITDITATAAQLNYLNTSTRDIQSQLDEKLGKNTAITQGTSTKVTYDENGLITSGSSLIASDIPSLPASKITSGTFTDSYIASAGTWNAKQDAITSSNKLPTSLISGLATVATSGSYTNLSNTPTKTSDFTNDGDGTNAFVTTAYHDTTKQDVISDLQDIRDDATAGATAATTIGTYGDIVTHDVSEFATSAQGSLADSALQPNDNISELTNDSGFITKNVNDLTNYSTTTAMNTAITNYHDSTKVNKNNDITSGTHTKITYDTKGLVTAGADLTASDIPNLDTSKVTSGQFSDSMIASAATWNAKQDALPVVVKNKYLHTDASTGAIEWSDPPAAAVSGVTSADVNIVKDGIAKITGLNLPAHNANKVIEGVFDAARIPDLAASKITSGTFADERIASADTWNAKQDAITDDNKLPASLVSGLATVATSGSYNDLTDQPAFVSNVSYDSSTKKIQKTIDGTTTDVVTLATVATSGSYNDLSNQPTIPVVNDALLTIQKNGGAVGTFTANAATPSTINITLTKSDVGLGDVVNTSDSDTPISGGTTKFTTGGAYTELAKKINTSDIADDLVTTTSGKVLSANQGKVLKDIIDNLPSPMVFKGTVGTGGTVSDLPTSNVRVGDTYKVITNGTYAGVEARVGDLFIAITTTPTWSHVPSGDDPSGTVTNVATGVGLTGGPITTSGTISLDTSGVTAGTYQGLTVDTYGRVTSAQDMGYTTNTGTVTSVSGGTGLTISGTASINPTVNIDTVNYKLPTISEWDNKQDALPSWVRDRYLHVNSSGTALEWSTAQGGVMGVKGNAETDYRTGNVNLTPANIGAQPALPTVTNDKYLHTNASTGALEWSTISAGVTGIKGNNESTYRTGQVNLTAANIGAEPADATILKKANVVDNVTTITADIPLSANQGKLLNDRINNLESIGRFLSVWNCITGLPTSEPETIPYNYRSGDYYRVGTVNEGSEGINYKPDGVQYTRTASTTPETSEVKIGDIYYYDGSNWTLQSGSPEGKVQDVQVDGRTILSGGIANITESNLPNLHLSKIVDVTATATELNYVKDVTSSIQTQLNNKSVVSISTSSGTSTTEAKYITVNGVEYVLPSGSGGGITYEEVL